MIKIIKKDLGKKKFSDEFLKTWHPITTNFSINLILPIEDFGDVFDW